MLLDVKIKQLFSKWIFNATVEKPKYPRLFYIDKKVDLLV